MFESYVAPRTAQVMKRGAGRNMDRRLVDKLFIYLCMCYHLRAMVMGRGKPIYIVHMSFVLELEELDGLVVVLLHQVFERAWVFRRLRAI